MQHYPKISFGIIVSIFALFSGQAASKACSSVGETPDKNC